jgi:predicted nuclease of predicted toxin-antitoxin system
LKPWPHILIGLSDRGLATASDSEILNFGHQEGMVVVTLDADFHTFLALSGLTRPSVIRIRIESLRGEALAKHLFSVLQICSEDLLKGAIGVGNRKWNQNSPAARVL